MAKVDDRRGFVMGRELGGVELVDLRDRVLDVQKLPLPPVGSSKFVRRLDTAMAGSKIMIRTNII